MVPQCRLTRAIDREVAGDASSGAQELGGSLVTRARLSRRPLDCALRDGFHIFIMLSVCQLGMATETGKMLMQRLMRALLCY
ncbi:MAG: hypothetical protein CM15mP74_07020 [Halieaceae bacterium]|nr:MAG: hypothetical protein CM15mP74_07020 [Halieaceae bacterium]